jgi:hypothetical protein
MKYSASSMLPVMTTSDKRLWWLAAIAVLFAVCDFALLPLVYAQATAPAGANTAVATLVPLLMGCVISQFLVLSMLAVLGPGTDWINQGIVWLVGVALMGSYFSGTIAAMKVHFDIIDLGHSMALGLFAVPAVFCGCQIPLWALRGIFRWRTAVPGRLAQNPGQMSIRGILIATAVVAIVLTLCRVGHWIENLQWVPQQSAPPLSALIWWTGIGIVAAVLLAVSTVVVPLTMLFALRARSGVMGIAMSAGYLAACICTFVFIERVASRRMLQLDEFLFVSMHYLGITAPLLATYAILRWAGYRLIWGRAMSPSERV